VLILSACGAQADPAVTVLRQNEVDWVRSYALWSNQLYRDVNRAEELRASILAGGSDHAALGRTVRRVEGCARRYLRNVGLPPSERLREGARLALSACGDFALGERLQFDALSGDPGEKIFAGDDALSKASEAFIQSDKILDAAFLWNRRLPRLDGVTARSRIEPLFSRVASSVANRRVEVRCWSAEDWTKVLAELRAWAPGRADPAGFVTDFESGRANLDPVTCKDLADLAYRHARPRGAAQLDLAYAAQVLSHEIQHLVSPGTEAETECYGMQALARVAHGLGASESYARTLAERFWNGGYFFNSPEYKSKLCRNGGPLDAHPASDVWP
jgi:hypothetical protein